MDEPTELELRDDTAEAALIGAVAFHGDALTNILDRVPGTDFYDIHRGYVWDACRELVTRREPLEPTRIARQLAATPSVNGTTLWTEATRRVVNTEMVDAVPPTYAAQHADTITDLAQRRRLIQALARARKLVHTHPGHHTEVAAAVRAELEPPADTQTAGAPGGALHWPQLIDEFRTTHNPEQSRLRVPTPWWEFDELTGGLFGGRVYVFGGRPGAGKSTAAVAAAAYAAIDHGHRVLIVSKEMPSVDVTGRILARGAEVNLQQIAGRRITPDAMARIDGYIGRAGTPALAVDARPRRLSGVKALARTHQHRYGLDLLVVDYLQLVHPDKPGRNREQEVAEVSRELKALSMELDIVVVLPAQLNRGSTQRADPRPTMSDLRDSGQIEQDADVVTLLHREKNDGGEYTGKIAFIVDKNRHGPTGEIALDWRGSYGDIA
jgi:replicative DNA helicase